TLAALPAGSAAAPPTKPCPADRAARCGSVSVPVTRGVPGSGKLRIAWSTRALRATASTTGTLGGRAVRLALPAP
ncbi:MAG: hypothetical protein QOE60_2234, partial [Thermoleophilaceae bacterium]|nr:hypothetical protein [Thermoleophilaceae bacterium]